MPHQQQSRILDENCDLLLTTTHEWILTTNISGAVASHTPWTEARRTPNPVRALAAPLMRNKKGHLMRPVIVTTEYRGVFFGFADDTSGDTIVLKNARNAIYWSSATGGFMGLACDGPAAGSRIGKQVEKIELRKVTSVIDVTDAAAAAWAKEPSYVG